MGLSPSIPYLVVFVVRLHLLLAVNKYLDPLTLECHRKIPYLLEYQPCGPCRGVCPSFSIIFNIPFPQHCERIQQLVALHILDQTFQVSRGESSWSFIFEISGSKPLVEKQSRIFQEFPSDLRTPNTSELGFYRLEKKVVQQPP